MELMKLSGKISAIQLNPFMGKIKKQDTIFTYLTDLSDGVFMVGVPILLKDFTVYGDRTFANTERQLEAIIAEHPRLQYFKSILRERVELGRSKSKLTV
jgi:carbamoylphosphate synthase large subunit